MAELYMHIGARIRTLRLARGLTQTALAKILCVSANTLSRWETGTYKISIKDLQTVAAAFAVDWAALLPTEAAPDPFWDAWQQKDTARLLRLIAQYLEATE